MPALPPVSKTLRCSLGFSINGAPAGSRFYMSYTGGPPTVVDLSSFAAALGTAWGGTLGAWHIASTILNSGTVQDLDTVNGFRATNPLSVAGTLVGTAMDAGTCVVVDFQIGRHYRGGKPRIYLPLGDTALMQGSTSWTPAFVTSINTAWGNFVSQLLGHSYASFVPQNHVNAAYYAGYNKNTPPWRGPGYKYPPMVKPGPIAPDVVQTHTTRALIGSQRRRIH